MKFNTKFNSINAVEIENRITMILAPFLNLKIRCNTVNTPSISKGIVAGNILILSQISPFNNN